MRHAPETFDRIRELLSISGVSQDDTLEEMLDHYLSDIERQMEQGISQQVANRTTFQKIVKTDLSYHHSDKNYKIVLAFASICFMLLVLYLYQTKPSPTFTNGEKHIEELAPDGWPLLEAKAHVTANFGLRMHPILKSSIHHNGVDIKARKGAQVLATGTGMVEEVGYSAQSGNYIIIKHNERYTTKYCHLSTIEVDEKTFLQKGNKIGTVGTTGMSTAPHLHYEIIDGTSHIDPLECTRA